MSALLDRLLRTKDLDRLLAAPEHQGTTLRRGLGAFDVTLIGIGAIIGAGIFATIGTAAAGDVVRPGAGPSLILSFGITAVVCAFTALCYAELAALVPISGSAYTYTYATLGELVAWIIGWDLILEYAIGNVAVAISWSNYFRSFLEGLGVHLPPWLCIDYRTALQIPGVMASAPKVLGVPVVFNLLAFGIVAVLTVVLVWGIRESARFNAVMVAIKIAALLLFIGVALYYVSPARMAHDWTPFQPNGWRGTLAGAAVVFFAYIGFDAASTVAEETRNPSRDMPVGILASLAICTLFYMVVAAVFTGILPYRDLVHLVASEQAEPLTAALQHIAPEARWAVTTLALGSVVAHTAVLLVFQLGQPRILMSMARDGLLPPMFARVHPRFRTPHVGTVLTGLAVGGVAAGANINEMVDLTNIGTLFAFFLVCIGVPVLRLRDPERHRPFRVPAGPWLLPTLGAASCLGLMVYLPPTSWWRFGGWFLVGLAIYVSYGFVRAEIARSARAPARARLPLRIASAGFLTAAAGAYLLPHDAGPVTLIRGLLDGAAVSRARLLAGVLLVLGGCGAGVAGWIRGSNAL